MRKGNKSNPMLASQSSAKFDRGEPPSSERRRFSQHCAWLALGSLTVIHCSAESSSTANSPQDLGANAGVAGMLAITPNAGAGAGAGGAAVNAGAGGSVAGAGPIMQGGAGGVPSSSAGTAGLAGVGGSAAGAGGAGGAPSVGGACDNPNWDFCDDFESYPLGGVPDGDFHEYDQNGRTRGDPVGYSIETTSDKKVSGMQSVKFHLDEQGRSFLEVDAPFPMPNNAFYGRMMIYMAQVPEGGVHWDIVSAYGEGGPEDDGTGNYRWGGMFGHTMANYHPGDPAVNVEEQRPTPNKWLCYEWLFDGPAHHLEVWIDDYDGTGADHGSISPDWQAPNPFTTVQIGWAHYQPQQVGADTWIDDLVIDDERIGCPDQALVP